MDYISFNRMLIQMHLVKMLPLFAFESDRLAFFVEELSVCERVSVSVKNVRTVLMTIKSFSDAFSFAVHCIVGAAVLSARTRALCACSHGLKHFSITESVAIKLKRVIGK